MVIHGVSFGSQLDLFFIPVDHRHGHLGTNPRPPPADGQQKVRRIFAIKHLGGGVMMSPRVGKDDDERKRAVPRTLRIITSFVSVGC